MEERRNYYEVLEITTDASQEEVHQAYQRSKNAYAGDSIALYSLMSKDACDEIVQLIEEAYFILSVPEKRREYDRNRGFNRGNEEAVKNSRDLFAEVTRPGFKSDTAALSENLQKIQQETSERAPVQEKRSTSSYQQSPDFLDKTSEFSLRRNEVSEVSKIAATNKFSLNYSPNPEMEQEIENATVFTGEFLSKIREYRKVEIPRLAEMTKISKTYLRCIESEDFENLPAFPYTRGFVYQYAKCLKLNPDLVATSYMHHLKNLKDGKA